ncbi:MAG: class I SAM-dependent methyltransferase [Clostridiales bacterium]|jgi:tRNA A22 N-methylase|nr:class I SAM-dependent methyltransferase [Clostridiales bacterium]
MLIKTGKRIDAALAAAGECGVLCDIGTDHGYLAAAAVLRGTARRVIATDISQKSLDKARRLFSRLGIERFAEVRRGDGFGAVRFDEADVFVVAGVGGGGIIDILRGGERRPSGNNKFVFVPHKNSRELRAFLTENGYGITRDRCVADAGKFYDVITAEFLFPVSGANTDANAKADTNTAADANACTDAYANINADTKKYNFDCENKAALINAAAANMKTKVRTNADAYVYADDAEQRELFLRFGRENFTEKNPDFHDMLLKRINEFDNILKTVYNIECERKLESCKNALRIYETGVFCEYTGI